MPEPYFDWFENQVPERKLECQVLLVAGAHRDSRVESDALRKILCREHTNPIAHWGTAPGTFSAAACSTSPRSLTTRTAARAPTH